MTGQSLYEVWQEEQAKQDVSVDSWSDISASDKIAWIGLADFIQELITNVTGGNIR